MSMRRTLAVGAAMAVALGLAVAGGATADKLIGSPQIKDGGVYSPDLHDGGVRSKDIRNGGVGLADLSPFLRDQLSSNACASSAGVEFAINDDGPWSVFGAPFAQRHGTITSDDVGKGMVHLATYPNGGYADAGIIVPFGTVADRFADDGSFQMPNFKGPYTDQVAVNLYVDASGDGAHFDIDGQGVFQGLDGDQVLNSVSSSTQRTQLAAGVTDDTKLWVWVGVSGNHAQTAALTRFAGHDLAVC